MFRTLILPISLLLFSCNNNSISNDKKIKSIIDEDKSQDLIKDIEIVPVDNNILIENVGSAQGTSYNIKYLAQKDNDLKYYIDSLLVEIDNSFSTWNDSSLISKLNRGEKVKVKK